MHRWSLDWAEQRRRSLAKAAVATPLHAASHRAPLKNFKALAFHLRAGTHRGAEAEANAATATARCRTGWLKCTQISKRTPILFEVVKSATSLFIKLLKCTSGVKHLTFSGSGKQKAQSCKPRWKECLSRSKTSCQGEIKQLSEQKGKKSRNTIKDKNASVQNPFQNRIIRTRAAPVR